MIVELGHFALVLALMLALAQSTVPLILRYLPGLSLAGATW